MHHLLAFNPYTSTIAMNDIAEDGVTSEPYMSCRSLYTIIDASITFIQLNVKNVYLCIFFIEMMYILIYCILFIFI